MPPSPSPSVTGHLAIVGMGITATSHVTLEARQQISSADVVFYHATSGVMANFIRRENANAVDLYSLYGEGKRRRTTYIQMAEVMLREVRNGRRVVGVFHGHPGFFVMAARRSLAIAKAEGHATTMLPGVSSVDCLICDLRIDPGVSGLQIMKAGSYLRDKQPLATRGHVVLLQVSSVGDSSFSFSGYKNSKFPELLNKLIAEYGAGHDGVYYVAPIFPGTDPIIQTRSLVEWLDPSANASSAGILYLPPNGTTFKEVSVHQAYQGGQPYNDHAMEAIYELATHQPDQNFKNRSSSGAIFQIMEDLATDALLAERFRDDPSAVLQQYPDLSYREVEALVRRDTGQLRAATTNIDHG